MGPGRGTAAWSRGSRSCSSGPIAARVRPRPSAFAHAARRLDGPAQLERLLLEFRSHQGERGGALLAADRGDQAQALAGAVAQALDGPDVGDLDQHVDGAMEFAVI